VRDDHASGGILPADDPRSSRRTMPIHACADTLGDVNVLETGRARIRAVDPFRADLVLAALFVIAGAIELYHIDSEGHNRPITVAAAILSLAGLTFRRRDPLIAAVIFTAPALIQSVLDGYLTTHSTTPFVAAMLLLYSAGRYADARRFRPAIGVLVVGLVLTLTLESRGFGLGDLLWTAFLFGLPVLAGRALRSRVLLQAELREKAEQAERDRTERARSAVEDERGRIAAELQELVANGLSAMVVQAEAVPRALAAGDSPGANAALAAVEETGREALTEMRTLLGVLRHDGDGLALAPQPGLARLEALVARNRERGLDVGLHVEGMRRALPPGIDLTAYRVIEDALDSATDSEAGRAEVLVGYRARELQLQVSDDRAGGESAGFPGLRDRVALYGGHLRADRLDEGGFRLRAGLPLEEDV
jgi:signal transduction histidine kinase